MRYLLIILGIIALLIALLWAISPIIYIEKTDKEIPFLVGVFAAGGYYGWGILMYRSYKDKVIKILKRLEK